MTCVVWHMKVDTDDWFFVYSDRIEAAEAPSVWAVVFGQVDAVDMGDWVPVCRNIRN